jgi:hypothetical protein
MQSDKRCCYLGVFIVPGVTHPPELNAVFTGGEIVGLRFFPVLKSERRSVNPEWFDPASC